MAADPQQGTPPATPPATPAPSRHADVPPAVTPESIGAAADPWAGAEPELRTLIAGKKWQTPADAVRGYAAAEKLLSRPADELVHVPKAGLTPEMRAALKQRILGTPEKPDAYDFGEIADQEGAPPLMGWWKETAHKLGLGQEEARQAAELFSSFSQEQVAAQEAATATARQTAAASLQAKHGRDFEAMRDAGARALAALGITDASSPESSELELALEHAMGPEAFFETFAQLGRKLGEHRLVEGKGTASAGVDELQAEVQGIMADQKGPYWVKDHPGHEAATKRVQEIMNKLHGDKPAWGPGSE